MSDYSISYSISKSLSTVLSVDSYGYESKIYWEDECGAADSGNSGDTFTVTSSSNNFAPDSTSTSYY